jgi:hypothetical protein
MGITVLGLDIATYCGVCWKEAGVPASDWRCYVIESEGDNSEDKAGDLAMALAGEFKTRRPDFAAIEMPQRSVTQFGKEGDDGERKQTINPNALQLSGLAGGAVACLDLHGIPWGLVAPSTWRSAYFGKGYKPLIDWKQSAIDMANIQKIVLPPTKKAQRDAAEAVGISVAWERCTFVPERHQRAFMALRTGRQGEAGPMPSFASREVVPPEQQLAARNAEQPLPERF